ncbi:ornithine cyclodeaminase family protein [Luteimonas sp. R10]|uniref:ornithine cyclodeaminase family protein n=1 Tax=Luteimonas sp. R10 TaxID=3108176 RepID=UPI00308FCC07|nr:ornithine cyclodeaminase family protein [Luteimonas sp. R10]
MLDPDEVLQAVREAFELHSSREGVTYPVIRETLSTGGIFGIKAGEVPSQTLLGFKAAGFWPGNRQHGGEPHQATILLFDPETGRPHCVIDGNAITTVRTGAAGALGLQALARPGSEVLTVFGTGVQARSQLSFALRMLPGIRCVRYFSVDQKPDQEFESGFAMNCDLQCAADPDDAVAHSDIVITATPGGGPLFSADAVGPGTHINCVGTDTRGKRELPPGLLERARLFVDDRQQALQLGEAQWASGPVACEELGELLAGTTAMAREPADITVFDMTGLAVQDIVVSRLVHQKAVVAGIGISISWPW